MLEDFEQMQNGFVAPLVRLIAVMVFVAALVHLMRPRLNEPKSPPRKKLNRITTQTRASTP